MYYFAVRVIADRIRKRCTVARATGLSWTWPWEKSHRQHWQNWQRLSPCRTQSFMSYVKCIPFILCTNNTRWFGKWPSPEGLRSGGECIRTWTLGRLSSFASCTLIAPLTSSNVSLQSSWRSDVGTPTTITTTTKSVVIHQAGRLPLPSFKF